METLNVNQVREELPADCEFHDFFGVNVRTITCNNVEEVRRSKRNRNPTVCYNEEKIIISNALNDKRQCVDSLNGVSTPGVFKIRIGADYQATNIPDYLGKHSCVDDAKQAETNNYVRPRFDEEPEHQAETIWLPPPADGEKPINVDEFCDVAHRHQGLSTDDALKALMDNGYDVAATLARLEEYYPSRPTAEWTEEEAEIFDEYITSRNVKQFRRVVKQIVFQLFNGKTAADVVEYYYRVKKSRCLTPPHKICPHRANVVSSIDLMPSPPRSKCHNCVNSAFATKSGKILRRRYDICLACGMYARLTHQHRPFTVKLCKQEFGYSGGPAAPSNNGLSVQQLFSGITPLYTNALKVKEKCQPSCYFNPRIGQLNNTKEWSADESLKCLKAMKRHGSDWEAVAKDIPRRTTFDVMQFYNEYKHLYRIDAMLAKSEKSGDDSPVHSANGNGCTKSPMYSQGGRILRACSVAALK